MDQSPRHAQMRPRTPGLLCVVVRNGRRRRRVVLPAAAAISLLASMVLASAAAGAAPSSAFAVTELATGGNNFGIAADPATNTVYAADGGLPTGISVIDGATKAVTTQISVDAVISDLAVDPASDTLYAIASSMVQPLVYVIDGSTKTVTATISLPSTFSSVDAAVNPLTHMVYAADRYNGAVVVIDGSKNTVAATIPLADPVLAPHPIAWGMAVDTATDTIYVADPHDNQVDVIDGATNTLTSRVVLPAGSTPAGVAVDESAGLVYVADFGTGTISVINTATDGVSTLTQGLSRTVGLALDSGTGTLYATAPGSSVLDPGTTYIVDTTTGSITGQIPRGGFSVAITPSTGGSAYVKGSSGPISDDVTVITPSTVNTMSPVIVSLSNNVFKVGQAGQGQLTASAIPAATFSSTDLPSWLTLSPSGLLSGTPPVGSGGITADMTVTAANGIAPTGSHSFFLVIDEAPTITSADQVTFQEGVAGSFTVTITGYPVGANFSETGALPAGVTFSSGVLSGTPAVGTAGSYPITITATNGSGTATQAFTLTVTPRAPALAVGVEGSDRQLWVQAPQLAADWQPLGGQIIAPPAVAAPPNPDGATPAQPLFIGTGSDKQLWIRSVTDGWQPIGAAQCIGGPAAVITGSTLTVACRGTDNALWYNTATMPSSGLPAFTGPWTSLGGVLSAGPAAAPVGTTLTFFVRGTSGAIYTRTLTTGYAVTPWSCAGQPAAALQAATGTTTFACNAGGALWESANSGSGWSPAVSLGGALLGGPAIAATSLETDFLAEGTDHAVWKRTPVGWVSLGGNIVGGVGAAALN